MSSPDSSPRDRTDEASAGRGYLEVHGFLLRVPLKGSIGIYKGIGFRSLGPILEVLLGFRGSYKRVRKPPNMSYNYSYPTYN